MVTAEHSRATTGGAPDLLLMRRCCGGRQSDGEAAVRAEDVFVDEMRFEVSDERTELTPGLALVDDATAISRSSQHLHANIQRC
jgi:hypothetical protein